jgi:hypothetical protein
MCFLKNYLPKVEIIGNTRVWPDLHGFTRFVAGRRMNTKNTTNTVNTTHKSMGKLTHTRITWKRLQE